MSEIITLANSIIACLTKMDIKATPNNLKQSMSIHAFATKINEIVSANAPVKATEIPVDKSDNEGENQ